MKKRIFALLVFMAISQSLLGAKVGLMVVATGKYIQFVTPLIQSAKKYFLPQHEVTIFVFTDGSLPEEEHVVTFYQERMGWPYDTMKRYHVYLKHKDVLLEQDYLFAMDADMLFVDYMGDEILGKRVATIHPGFIDKRGTYETNRKSKSYVNPKEGTHYFAGGFYGGIAEEVMQIAKTNVKHIEEDLKKGLIAVWHDESHWNRYCIDHKPTVILNPSYCYPESWNLPYPKKLLALDKEHSALRTP